MRTSMNLIFIDFKSYWINGGTRILGTQGTCPGDKTTSLILAGTDQIIR